jgi:hypothetical protein
MVSLRRSTRSDCCFLSASSRAYDPPAPGGVPMASWSLASELCQMTATSSPRAALTALGILTGGPESELELMEKAAWHRSGAETYSYTFAVREDQKQTEYRLKACVAFSPGSNPERILASWLSRRALFERAGGNAPRLFGSAAAVLLEEEIPFDVPTILSGEKAKQALQGLVAAASVLARLQFSPLNAFADMRSRGGDVVLVDFGTDLGPADRRGTPEKIFGQLLAQLARWRVPISPEERSALHSDFHARVTQTLH